mgnify:FL=1
MSRQRKGLLLLLALLLACGGWWLWHGRAVDKQLAPAVKADSRILAEGIVFPVQYASLIMPVEGTVAAVLVAEGDPVTAGQILIKLEQQDYQARLGSVRADMAKAAAAVEQSEVNLADAVREQERQRQLLSMDATPRQQYDQAVTATERSRAALSQAQAELMTQSGRVAEAEGLMGKTELRSPLKGTVAYLEVKPGEHASFGAVLVRIADESAWEVRSDDLTELAIAKVRVGDKVELTFDGIPGLVIPGQVSFIRPYGEKKRGDITYTVTIAPTRWDERLRWNMTAQIAITPRN